jgi:type II secretory pathway component PulC
MKSFFVIFPLLFVTACNMRAAPAPIHRFDAAKENFKGSVEEVLVSKEDLSAGLKNDVLSRLRMIPLTKAQSDANQFPEYRIFEVRKGSPYDLLKLQDNDVILSAEEYVIPDPRVFFTYISIMPKLGKGSIEIKRRGELLQYRYTVN